VQDGDRIFRKTATGEGGIEPGAGHEDEPAATRGTGELLQYLRHVA
jgi:hypothetical protein